VLRDAGMPYDFAFSTAPTIHRAAIMQDCCRG
jgi:hypothetical protein